MLSNHDVYRHATRYGGGAVGLARARAAALFMHALPGSAYVYEGEELGLPEVLDLPEESLQDPTWERSGHTVRGRDGCRVPIPWSGGSEPYGFGPPGSDPWLPQPAVWAELSVEAQDGVPGSTLTLYRDALRLRRTAIPRGEPFAWVEGLPDGVLAFRRGGFLCVVNVGDEPFTPPVGLVAGAELLLASDPDAYADPTAHPPRRHDRLVPHPLTPHPFS